MSELGQKCIEIAKKQTETVQCIEILWVTHIVIIVIIWFVMFAILWISHIIIIREGCTKQKPEKVWSFAKPGGGLGG